MLQTHSVSNTRQEQLLTSRDREGVIFRCSIKTMFNNEDHSRTVAARQMEHKTTLQDPITSALFGSRQDLRRDFYAPITPTSGVNSGQSTQKWELSLSSGE